MVDDDEVGGGGGMIRKSVKAKNLDLAKAENFLSCDASNLLFEQSLSSQQVHRVQELSQYYFRTDYRAADALSRFSCSPATAFIEQHQIFGSEPLRHLLQALRLCTKCSSAALPVTLVLGQVPNRTSR